MLHENEKPPEFILPDKSSGGQLALSDLLGHSRILIVLVPTEGASDEAQAYLETAAKRIGELRDRDLQFVSIIRPASALCPPPDSFADMRIHIVTDASGETARQYDGESEHPCAYLVGKDGTIKLAQTALPDWDDLFALIDSMPMRQAEMAGAG